MPRDFTLPLLTLGIAVVGSNSLALSPILTDVAHSLAATPVQVARANAAYGGATALSALLLGAWVDRVGPRRVLVAGLAVLALAMLASAASLGWLGLAAAQALAGVAAGLVLPATYTYATAVAAPGQEARTLGQVLNGWSISLVAGVPLSALLAATVGWRASYGMLALLLAVGSAGVSRLPDAPATGPATRGLGAALRVPGVVPLLLICLAFMTAFYGVYAYVGDHVQTSLGVGAARAGLLVLCYGLGFGLASLLDRHVDRIGPRRLFPVVLAVMAVFYGLMIPGSASYPAMLALAAAWGCANHFGLNILVLLLGRADPTRRGAVLALNSAASYAGALLGASLFGVAYDAAGFRPVAALAAASMAFAALIALRSAAAAGRLSPAR